MSKLGSGDSPAEFESVDTDEAAVNHALTYKSMDDGAVPSAPQANRQFSKTQRPRPSAPVICWSFDDGWASLYEHRDFFDSRNVQVAFNIITDNVGKSGYMTWDEIRELSHSYGWEVASHSKTGDNFGQLSEDQIETEVRESTQKLLEEGVVPTSYVYSGGIDGGDTGRAIVLETYDYAWGTGGGTLADSESPSYLSRVEGGSGVSKPTLKGHIDTAVSKNVGLVFFAHEVIDGTTADENNNEISTSKIDEIITYARNNGATWGTHSETVEKTGAFFRLGGLDGNIQRTPQGSMTLEAASGRAINIYDSGRNNLIGYFNDGGPSRLQAAAGILELVANNNNLEVHLDDGNRLRIYDENDNDMLLFHPDGAAGGGTPEIDYQSTREINKETGATNADHTTAADNVWLVEGDDGTVYEVPLRTH